MRRAMVTPPGPFALQDLVAAVAKVYLDRCGLIYIYYSADRQELEEKGLSMRGFADGRRERPNSQIAIQRCGNIFI